MYKVLLVDDERIILEGISQMVDWDAYGTELIGTARNGIEAFERIAAEAPDIVICDIRMPGMDGLELVRRVNASDPRVRFAMLSGFREFEYASQAMHLGVRHYLLKPTNEAKIGEALKELAAELSEQRQEEAFVRGMREELAKVVPHVKEQFLKELVTNKTYGKRDWEHYRNLFHLEADYRIRLLLFRLEDEYEYEHLFAIKNIAEDLLEAPLLGTTIGNQVLFLLEDREDVEPLYDRIHMIRDTFRKYYKMDTTCALSEADELASVRTLYRETLQLLGYSFYLGEGGLITKKDAAPSQSTRQRPLLFDDERLIMAVKSGDRRESAAALQEFIGGLKEAQLDIEVTKSYVIEQFVSLVRNCAPERMGEYLTKIPLMMEMGTLQACGEVLGEAVMETAEQFFKQNQVKHNAIIRKVLDIIDEQLGNSELSLNWVANEMLYMNADYLGKLFKKEIEDKFSTYVMKMRIRKATELMSKEDLKIFELAERLGFGDNPQYFSQVFKKYTGTTPSEYNKSSDNSIF